jgi:ketosteroid isomerase-like protein
LDSLIAPQFTFELMTDAPGFPNKMNRAEFLDTLPKMLAQILPNGFNYTCGNAVAEGDHVAMQGTCDSVTAGGRKYANRYHWYFRFAGDKIDNFREYMDAYAIMEAFKP